MCFCENTNKNHRSQMNFHFRRVKRKKRTNAWNIVKIFGDARSLGLTHNIPACHVKFVQIDVVCTGLQMRETVSNFTGINILILKGFIFYLQSTFHCLLNIHIHGNPNLFLLLKKSNRRLLSWHRCLNFPI